QAEDGIRDYKVTGVQTCALPISNIQIHEGEVHFDDKLLKGQHVIKHLELDVPFIANLPADVNIFVQPLLQMVIDGSLVRITGKEIGRASCRERVEIWGVEEWIEG